MNRKKFIILCAVVISVIIAGVVIGITIYKSSEKNKGEQNIIDPAESALVFADPFPVDAQAAAALIKQKAYLVCMEDRYHITRTLGLSAGEMLAADKVRSSEKKEISSVLSAAERLFKPVDIEYGESTKNAMPDLSVLPLPSSYTASCTENGVFLITLEYGKEAAAGITSDFFADCEGLLQSAFADGSFTAIQLDENGFVIDACVDGVHGTLSKLEITQRYNVTMQDDGSITFPLEFIRKYDILREAVWFEQKAFTVKKGHKMRLPLILNLPEDISPDDYTLSFVSSEEACLTVDEKGVVYAHAISEEPVIVTVMLTLNNTNRMMNDLCEIKIAD